MSCIVRNTYGGILDVNRDVQAAYTEAVAAGATPSTSPIPTPTPTPLSSSTPSWVMPVVIVGSILFLGGIIAVTSYNTRMRAKGKPGLTLFALSDRTVRASTAYTRTPVERDDPMNHLYGGGG
jgi:hypothetical protein